MRGSSLLILIVFLAVALVVHLVLGQRAALAPAPGGG